MSAGWHFPEGPPCSSSSLFLSICASLNLVYMYAYVNIFFCTWDPGSAQGQCCVGRFRYLVLELIQIPSWAHFFHAIFLWNWMFTCTSVLLLFGVPIKFHTKFRSGVFCTHFHTVFQSCTFCIFSMAAFFRKPKIELEFLLLVLIYLYFWCLWLYCDILYQNSPLFRQNENKTWDKFEPNFSSPPGQGISYIQFLHQQLYHPSSTQKDSPTWSTVGLM